MKYLEVTFTTHPCNETVNDVVSALAGEIGFESFVECEAGVQAYIQQTLFDEEALKVAKIICQYKFIPATHRGETVETIFPIMFLDNDVKAK